MFSRSSPVIKHDYSGTKGSESTMNGITLAMVAGSVLLMMLHLLSFQRGANFSKRLVVTGVFLGVLFGVMGVHVMVFLTNRFPRSSALSQSKAVAGMMLDIEKNPPENVIVLLGGSYAALGVDWTGLENSIKQVGYSVKVIPFMIPGANHFERLSIVRDSKRVSGKLWDSLEKVPNIRILEEIHKDYDANPLAALERNFYSDRTLGYLHPKSAMLAILSICESRQDGVTKFGTMDASSLVSVVSRHGLINVFNIGVFFRTFKLESVVPNIRNYQTNGSAPNFVFKTLDRMVQEGVSISKTNVSSSIEWKHKWFYPELMRCFPSHASIANFTMPNSNGSGFAQEREYQDRTVFSMSNDIDSLKLMNDPEMWWDSNHLNANGAKCFTDWLFEELVSDVAFLKK